MDGESIKNGSKTITTTWSNGHLSETLPTITWYGDAPTYNVTETEIPGGWRMKEITFSRATLESDESHVDITVNCINEYFNWNNRQKYNKTCCYRFRLYCNC